MQNAFEPDIYVKVRKMSTHTVPEETLQNIHRMLKYNYETMLDTEHGVIYIGKKV